jgi:transposase InsO family protein
VVEEVTPRTNEPVCVFVAEWQTPPTEATEPSNGQAAVSPGLPPGAGAENANADAKQLQRVREVIEAAVAAQTKPRRRGRAGQQRLRLVERNVRHDAVDFYFWLKEQGGTCAEAACLLDISARTLRHWDQHQRGAAAEVAALGRPAKRATVRERQAVLNFIHATDQQVSVPALQAAFPALGRNELAELTTRRLQALHDRYHDTVHVLHWQQPGRVLAIDFAEPSLRGASGSLPPIAGLFPYLLAVRDLASGCQLAWLPLAEMTERATQLALAHLFAVHGTPLVLKMDNGSAFRARSLQEFLAGLGVICLYSPPHCPGYNGTIEASIGSLKTWTEQHAAWAGHPGRWTTNDLAAALERANQNHPRRLHGRTPAEVWAERTKISPAERAGFELAVARERLTARSELHLAQDKELDHWQGAAMDRVAISRALVGRGYLLFRRRSIPLTINHHKVANNR